MNITKKKALARLSLKSFAASWKLNLIAIFAIILTTLLFSSLFTVYISMDKTIELQECKNAGMNCSGYFICQNDEMFDKLNDNSMVSKTGKLVVLGSVNVITEQNLVSCDAESADMVFLTPMEGTLPSDKKDIVMNPSLLDALELDKKLGSDVKLTYTVQLKDGGISEITDTFKLCGLSEDCSPYIAVSDEYVKEMISQNDLASDNNTLALFSLKSNSDINGKIVMLAEDLGIGETNIEPNPYYSYSSETLGPEGIVSIIIFILLITFAGFLIIYNIFQITVAGKVRNYGLLKTVGVTSRQLRKIMNGEVIILCLIGIPIGLVAGYFIGNTLVPTVLSNTIYGKDLEIISGFNILIFLGAAFFSAFTVWISSFIPFRKASKVSSIEALRYNDAKVSTKKHSANRAKITNMALSNLGRNKKRTFMVLLSLALAVVMLNTLCAFLGNVDVTSYIHSMAPDMDFTVSTKDYFMGEADQAILSDKEIEMLEANIDSKRSGRAYMTGKVIVDIEGEEEYFSHMVGVDESLIDEVTVLDGDIDKIYDSEGYNIAVVASDKNYKVGDKLPLLYTETTLIKNKETGEVFDPSTDDLPENLNQDDFDFIREGNHVEFTVCAVLDELPNSFSPKYSFIEGIQMLVSPKSMDDFTEGDYFTLCYCADARDDEAYEQAENYISGFVKNSDRLQYNSIATIRAEFKQFTGSVIKVGSVLVIILGIIGILNFVNAVLTSIISRKRELALLKAVGMTDRQQKRMLFTEGLFYSVFSLILAVPICILMNILIGNIGLFWLAETTKIVLWPLLIILPVFALLSYIMPVIMYGRIKGDSIVDDLRINE